MIGIIIALILAALVGGITIWLFVAILEILKIVALGVLIPLTFLWLWGFLKKTFKLDAYISAGLSLLMTSFIGIFVYRSWWAIIGLAVIVTIGYIAWKMLSGIGIIKLIKILGKKEGERK